MIRKSFISRSRRNRVGAAIDMLVLMMATILLIAWILGTLFLTFFADGQTGSSGQLASGSQTADGGESEGGADDPSALNGSEEGADGDPDGTDGGSGNSEGGDGSSSDAPNNDAPNNDAMKAEMQSLQQQIGQLKTDAQSKQDEIATLSKERDDLSEKLKQAVAQKQTTDTQSKQEEIATLSKERDDLSEKLKQALAQKQTLTDEFQLKLQQAKAAMTTGVAAAGATNGPTPEELAQLQRQRDEMQSQLTAMKNQFQTVRGEVDAQKTEITSLSTKLVASENRAKTLAQELEQSRLRPTTPAAEPVTPVVSNPPVAEVGIGNGPLDYRVWTSSRGSEATLAFLRWDGDRVVVVNEEGKEFRLPLNRFSPADQAYANGRR